MMHLQEEVSTSRKVNQMAFQNGKCVNVTPVFSGPEETFYHYGQGQNRHFKQVFALSRCFAENWFRHDGLNIFDPFVF